MNLKRVMNENLRTVGMYNGLTDDSPVPDDHEKLHVCYNVFLVEKS